LGYLIILDNRSTSNDLRCVKLRSFLDFRSKPEACIMAGSVKEFTDGNWKSEVLDSTVPVVVDFWAPWCGPCRMLAPTIEKLAGEYEGKVKVGKMNTDENVETPGSLRISAIPTVLVFHNGKEVDRLVGVNPETKFKAALDKLVGVAS
jgi:thioredoxin 1